MKLRILQKIRFCLLESGRTKPWCPGLVSWPSDKAQEPLARSRGQWQEVEGLLFNPKNSQLVHILSFVPRVWFSYLSFQQVRQPSIPSPVEEDTSKIRDTTGTIFIQGPSILLLVWRSIMFNGSFLRVCRILRFVKKLDFGFLSLGGPSHGSRVWCLGRVPKHRNHWQEVQGSGKKQRACYLTPKTLSWCIF